jgi:transketolase
VRRTFDVAQFEVFALAARRRLLRMHYEAQVGHIGGNLSALDAILYLYAAALREDDVFVLSKGHAAGALYIALWSIGLIEEDELASFHKEGTRLAGHPVAGWHDRIAFGTGSLGHGLGLASGVALGKRLRGEPGRVYCMLSDGECQEGSTWESFLFAGHQKLTNLVVMIDANGLQGFGSTNEVASLDPLTEKLSGFGLRVVEIDGHSPLALHSACKATRSGPTVIVMRTVKGRGVSFMENKMEWHYLPLNNQQYEAAMLELAADEPRDIAKPRRRRERPARELVVA